MLRSVTLGLALSVVVTACALVEPPIPAGTFALQGEVRNAKAEPVQVEVRTSAGAVPGAVQPGFAPAHATTKVTFYIPLAGHWSIWADDEHLIDSTEPDLVSQMFGGECTLGIEVQGGGGFGWGCRFP